MARSACGRSRDNRAYDGSGHRLHERLARDLHAGHATTRSSLRRRSRLGHDLCSGRACRRAQRRVRPNLHARVGGPLPGLSTFGHVAVPVHTKKLDDLRLLHAHSVDAAQEGFYKACKTARAIRDIGGHYPHHRERYRTTIWKSSGTRLKDDCLVLAQARGQAPVVVCLPAHLVGLPVQSFLGARLVYDRAARHYQWHVVVAGVDLGEIHPSAVSDGRETVLEMDPIVKTQKQAWLRCDSVTQLHPVQTLSLDLAEGEPVLSEG